MEVAVIDIGRVGLVAAYFLAEFDIRETGELTQLHWRRLNDYVAINKANCIFSKLKTVVRLLTTRAARLAQSLKVRLQY